MQKQAVIGPKLHMGDAVGDHVLPPAGRVTVKLPGLVEKPENGGVEETEADFDHHKEKQ